MLKILKKCPCVYKEASFDFFAEEEDETPVSHIYERVKDNWEWLSLRYERRLNEFLTVVKSSQNNKAADKVENLNLSNFLSFTPGTLHTHLYHSLSRKVTDAEHADADQVGAESKPFPTLMQTAFDGNSAVMFCDISGFTHLSELIENSDDFESASNLGQFLNNFFDPLINLIHFHGGDIIKFSGDALLSIFYATDKPEARDAGEESRLVEHELEAVDPEEQACINCLKCCAELHSILNNYPIPSGNGPDQDGRIKLHIGCSFGKIRMKFVGGILGRFEYYLMGEPLNDLSHLSSVSKSDQTVLSGTFYEKVKKVARAEQIEYGGNVYFQFLSFDDGSFNDTPKGEFAGLQSLEAETPSEDSLSNADDEVENMNNYYDYICHHSEEHMSILHSGRQQLITDRFYRTGSSLLAQKESALHVELKGDEQLKEKYIQALSYFIPRYIYNKLLNGFNLHTNEMRRITVLFANFQMPKSRYSRNKFNNRYSDLSSWQGLSGDGSVPSEDPEDDTPAFVPELSMGEEVEKKIDVIMKMCQKACYSFEGSINKLLLDDKGLIVLMLMGFPPLFHEDDPFRALLCGLRIARDSKKLKVNTGIGISTGKVWCGILGNKVRREYTALGDIVNVACRLMTQSFNNSTKCAPNSDTPSSSIPYNILTDTNTFNECKRYTELVELDPIKLKGKSDIFKVYTPTGKLYASSSEINTFVSEGEGATGGNENQTMDGGVKARDLPMLDTLYSFNDVNINIMTRLNNFTEGKAVLWIGSNDSNSNHLIYSYLNSLFCRDFGDPKESNCNELLEAERDKLVEKYRSYKILSVNCTNDRLVYTNLEDTYKLLVLSIMKIWSSSSKRTDFFNSYLSSKVSDDEKAVNLQILKELLDPKLHWNLDILNKLITNLKNNNHLLKLFFSNISSNNGVMKLFYGANGSNGSGGDGESGVDPPQNQAEFEDDLEKKLLLLIEKEKLGLNDYIYSLIEGINMHYPIVLIVNLTNVSPNVENDFVQKLLHSTKDSTDHAEKGHETKRDLTIVVISDSLEQGAGHDPVNITNLTKSQIKGALTNAVSSDVDTNVSDSLVEKVFNRTNGMYYFTYKYLEHLLSNRDHYFGGEEKADLLDFEDLDIEITNYFKYRLDKLGPLESLILKILAILDEPISEERLHTILDRDDHGVDLNRKYIGAVLNKLCSFNMVMALDVLEDSTPTGRVLDSARGTYVVNNTVLKSIINERILSEEKIHILKSYSTRDH